MNNESLKKPSRLDLQSSKNFKRLINEKLNNVEQDPLHKETAQENHDLQDFLGTSIQRIDNFRLLSRLYGIDQLINIS